MASSRLEKQQERANALYTCLQTHIERLNQTDTKEVHTLRGLRDGLIKLATAARAEAKALQQAAGKSEEAMLEAVTCSNLLYLETVAKCALTVPGVVDIWRTCAQTLSHSESATVCIDVVAHWGRAWYKVTGQHPMKIERDFLHQSSPFSHELDIKHHIVDSKDVKFVERVKWLVRAAQHHQAHYTIPKVYIWTPHMDMWTKSDGPVAVYRELIRSGVEVIDEQSEAHLDEMLWQLKGSASLAKQRYISMCIDEFSRRPIVNLDTTVLMALCSEISHLSRDALEQVPKDLGVSELDRQVMEERYHIRAKQQVEHFLSDGILDESPLSCTVYSQLQAMLPPHCQIPRRRLVVMEQSAWDKFHEIVSMLGGEHERERARQLQETGALDPLLQAHASCDQTPSTPSNGYRWPVLLLSVNEQGQLTCASTASHTLSLPADVRIHCMNKRLTPAQRRVFGLGDALRATTLTANGRAARIIEQALGPERVSIWLHPARSLCEVRIKHSRHI